MVELALRLVLSLAVVLGMVMVLAKLSSKRFRGSSDSLVRVLHRQPLTRGSAVSVVTIGTRVLVLGTTEQRVELLTELDPAELELDVDELLAPAAAPAATPVPTAAASTFAPALEAALRREASSGPGGRHAAPRSRRRPTARPTPTRRPPARVPPAATSSSPLAGSVLSPQTWKQAFAAVTRKAQNVSELGAS